MYIRRKVFSIALDENGEERLFSTKEIATEEKKKGLSKGKKAAIAAGALAGVGAAGIAGAKKLGKRISTKANTTMIPVDVEKAAKIKEKIAKNKKLGEALQKPADKIMKGARKVFKK